MQLELWQSHYQTLHYSGDWSAIPLRSTGGSVNNIIIAPHSGSVYADTPFLQSSPYLQEVLSTFHCPLNAVRLLKLGAGAIIKEHKDADLCYEKGEVRIHIPIITDPLVEFILDQERMFPKAGECWYMNFNLPHSINNFSDHDRVHLVIDAEVNDWVKDFFQQVTLLPKKEMDEEKILYDEATKKEMINRLREMNTETSNRMADELAADGLQQH